jgi:hypothetical protein
MRLRSQVSAALAERAPRKASFDARTLGHAGSSLILLGWWREC